MEAEPEELTSDPGRLVLMPTAWTLRRGQRTFNNYMLTSFDFQLGLGENWQLGVQTAVPFAVAGLGLSIRAGKRFSHGSIALQSQVFGGYLFLRQADAAFMAGGGPILTLGNEDHFISLSTMVFAVFAVAPVQNQSFGLLLPAIGGSIRVARRARLVAEVWFPGRTDSSGRQFGELFVALTGFRIFGRAYWADIGVFRHFCRPACNDFYSGGLTAGLPYVNLGRVF